MAASPRVAQTTVVSDEPGRRLPKSASPTASLCRGCTGAAAWAWWPGAAPACSCCLRSSQALNRSRYSSLRRAGPDPELWCASAAPRTRRRHVPYIRCWAPDQAAACPRIESRPCAGPAASYCPPPPPRCLHAGVRRHHAAGHRSMAPACTSRPSRALIQVAYMDEILEAMPPSTKKLLILFATPRRSPSARRNSLTCAGAGV